MGYTGTKVRIKITASSRSVRLLWRGQMMGYEAGTTGAMSKPETHRVDWCQREAPELNLWGKRLVGC